MSLLQHKKLLFVLSLVIATAIPLTVSLLPKQQETRTNAAKTTRLFIAPSSSAASPILKSPGETFTLDLMVEPGQNIVSFLKFQLEFDPSILSMSGADALQVNTAAFPVTIEGPFASSGRIAASLSIGNDPALGIAGITKFATIRFTALKPTTTPVEIRFTSISQVLSLGENEQASENVLESTTPAYVQIAANGTVFPTSNPTTIPSVNPSVTQNPTPTVPITGCINLAANLTGNQEVPATNSTADGQLSMRLIERTANGMRAELTLSSTLQNQVTAAHIHGPADIGIVAPAKITVYTGNATATFPDLFSREIIIPEDLLNDLQSGKTYINVHTNQYPDGEIRGQIICAKPTPTIDPNNTRLQVTLLLHGIGSAGDNPNPRGNSLSNKNPEHKTRPVSIQVLNNDNKIMATKLISVAYNQETGDFRGTVDLGKGLENGNYVIKMKSERYLRRLLPGFYPLSPGKEFTLRTTDLVAGDVNDDNVLNILDYNVLFDCGYGALNPLPMKNTGSLFQKQTCQAHTFRNNADLNDNGTISSSDYNLFVRELSVLAGE